MRHVLLAMTCAPLLACAAKPTGNALGGKNGPARQAPITTATAETGDIGVYLSGLGTVTPLRTVTVTARVVGQITSVGYREGQTVRAGDSLVQIDARPYEAALRQAEGQLIHDQAVLKESRIDSDRYRQAFERNAIPKQQLDDQEQAVKQNEGTVKADEGTVANAKVNLSYCHITSPIDGRVGLRLVDPGNILQSGSTTALVVVTQLQPITVIFSVAEDSIAQIQKQVAQAASMPVDAFDRTQQQKIATGSFLALDNQVDTTTGTIRLKALFPNHGSTLFPNQFVNARLLVETEHDVTVIPLPAVQRNANGTFVYVIKPDATAEMRSIKLGTVDGERVAVEGLKAKEVIAASGFDKLQDGIKVVVKNETVKNEANAATHPAAGSAR